MQAKQIFQFTPLREGRRFTINSVSPVVLFQFTPLREGRLDNAERLPIPLTAFQFTPLREGRPKRRRSLGQIAKISIHAPA